MARLTEAAEILRECRWAGARFARGPDPLTFTIRTAPALLAKRDPCEDCAEATRPLSKAAAKRAAV